LATAVQYYSQLPATLATYNQIVSALSAGDHASAQAAGMALRSELNAVNYPALQAIKLLSTNANPNQEYPIGSSVSGLTTATLPTTSQLDPSTILQDMTFVQTMQAISTQVDQIMALLQTINPANIQQSDVTNLTAALQQMQLLQNALCNTTISPVGLVNNLGPIEAVVGAKLPGLQQALAQFTLAAMNANGFNVRVTDPRHHWKDGVYRPGPRKRVPSDTALRLADLEPIIELEVVVEINTSLTGLVNSMYGDALRSALLDMILFGAADLFPENFTLEYDQDGFCDERR
jgi:hypothetical protein